MFLWPTSGGNYRCYPVGVLQNTAGTSGGAWGGGMARGKRRESPSLPRLNVVSPSRGNCLALILESQDPLRSQGETWEWRTRDKGGRGGRAGRIAGWRLLVLCCPGPEGSSSVRLPGYPGSDLVTSQPWLSEPLALVRLGERRAEGPRAPKRPANVPSLALPPLSIGPDPMSMVPSSFIRKQHM